jgi:hypothetical protein
VVERRNSFEFVKKTALILVVIAVALSVVLLIQIGVTGTGVPYPDPTPAQAAYERSQGAISSALIVAAACAWVATLAVGALYWFRRVN